MASRTLIRCVALAALACAPALSLAQAEMAADAPTTKPSTQPSTAPTLKPMMGPELPGAEGTKISPEAKKMIEEMTGAYAALKSLEVKGTLTGDFDVAGTANKESKEFTGSFQAPNFYRHELTGLNSTGSTGEKVFAFDMPRSVYLSFDAPKEKVTPDKIPGPVSNLLQSQNPSLLLAVIDAPDKVLTDNATDVSRLPDTTIDSIAYPTLQLAMADNAQVTMLIDPATHLLRQVKVDAKANLIAQGAPDVKSALVTIDYASSTPNAQTKPDQFAWAPPEGAKDLAKQAPAGGDGGDAPAMSLEGKPAPDLKLPLLSDGKEVTISGLKGSVVVLDMWATWCGPCVASLPHLDKLHKDKKDAGVKIFAVNLQEEKDKVQAFVESKKLTVPVLMDTTGASSEPYKITGIPQTVVIGKDGNVRKVFIGSGPDTPEQLQKEVEEALK